MNAIQCLQKSGIAILTLVYFAAGAAAQIPEGIAYQGYLTDAGGQPLDQPVTVIFTIYAAETGGSPLWSETQALVPSLGLFATTLGAGASPFPTGLFTTPLWMGVTVGTDSEMTPRRPLTTVAYAKRADDADTVGGLPAFVLDQSADVTTLQSDLFTVNTNIGVLGTNITANANAVASLEPEVDSNASDISLLQTDLAATDTDLAAVESTLPTLQPLVTGNCSAGSAIRMISGAGTVTCEADDIGPWNVLNNAAYYLSGNVGVGTSSPSAAVQIDAPAGVDPFRARVQSSTKLRVHSNGSVSVGTSSAGPADGLYVLGDTGLGTMTPGARLSISDTNWQLSIPNFSSGGNEWFVGSSADAWASGGGKFLIGPTNLSNNAALTIDGNKNVGIGAVSPATRLHLAGGSDVTPASGGYLTLGLTSGSNIAIDNNEIMARSNGSAAQLALNAEGGRVTVNVGGSRDADAMLIVGRVEFDNGGRSGMRFSATTSTPTNALLEPTIFEEGILGGSNRPFWRTYSREFYAQTPLQYKTYSDRALKRNIQPIPNALATINALEGVTYELGKHPMDNRNRELTEEQEFDRRHQLGFIAQDLEKIIPQMVSEDETTGLKTVGYMGVIPILVEAIKEQQRQIDELRAQLK